METDVKYATQVTNDITTLLLQRHNISDPDTGRFQNYIGAGITFHCLFDYQPVNLTPGRNCRHIPAGGRYRCDEHHAGVGAGENQGNRNSKGIGSKRERYLVSIPGRSGCPNFYRWHHWCYHRLGRRICYQSSGAFYDRCHGLINHPGGFGVNRDWYFLRVLSRLERLPP